MGKNVSPSLYYINPSNVKDIRRCREIWHMEYSFGRALLQKPYRKGQEELSGVIHRQAHETIKEFLFQKPFPRHEYVGKIEAYGPHKGHNTAGLGQLRITQEGAGPGNHDGDDDYVNHHRDLHLPQMGPQPQKDRCAHKENDQGTHPGPCACMRDREKTKHVEHVSYQERDQAQEKRLSPGYGEAYIADQAENKSHQQEVVIPGDWMGLNQDSNDEQQRKSTLRGHKGCSRIEPLFEIEKPDQQNGRQYDDNSIQHSHN